MSETGHRHHEHGHHPHPDDERAVEQLVLEGEAFAGFLASAMDLAAEHHDATRVRHVLDVGCGPGVGTLQLARRFPDATVLAVDASPVMLDHVRHRGDAHGLQDRVGTHQAELPEGMAGTGPADLVWASMSLHHVGDEVAAIAALGGELADDGLLVIAEMAGPQRTLVEPDDADTAALLARVDAAWGTWFAAMRAALPGHRSSLPLPEMVVAAGLHVVAETVISMQLDAPIGSDARAIATRRLQGASARLAGHLADDDLAALTDLLGPDREDGFRRRPIMQIEAGRQLVIARRG